LKFGANGVLLSLVISNTVAIVWMLFDLGKHHLFCFCINKQLLREALHYSIPIIPHNLSTHIAQFVSRVFINANTSLVSVGLFGLASKFGSLADMVQNSVNMAFQPWFFEQLSKREALDTKQIVSLSNSLVWLYGIVFLGLALFSQELIALMATDAYQSSWMLVPLIVAVFAIKTPYYFYINILFYYKKAAKYIFIATVSSSLLNVFLSYFFIKAWGMFGSVAADAIAMLLRVGIVVYLANKFSKIGYSLIRFGLHFLFLLLCMVVGLYPSYVQGNASVSIGACLYKIGVLIVFCIIALWANKGSVGGTLAILRKRR
jgi:O-antigen/teichoic acid export membrane protein